MWLAEIRKFLNENRLYAGMLVFVLLFSAVVNIISASPKYEAKKAKRAVETKELYDRIQGKLKIDEKKLRILMSEKRDLIYKMSAFAFGCMGSFLLGLGLLIIFVSSAHKNKNLLKGHMHISRRCKWGFFDVLKVMITFVFLSQALFIVQLGLISAMGLKEYDKGLSAVLNTTIMDLAVILIIIYMIRENYGVSLSALGLKLDSFFKNILTGIAGYIATIPILFLVLALSAWIINITKFKPPIEPVFEIFFEEKRTYVLSYLSVFVAVLGPIAEEIFFRGFAYPAARKRWGRWKGIILVSAFFALLHTNLVGFLPIFILGALLAALYERTGSLVPSITVHIIHNSLMIYLMLFVKELAAI